MSLKNVNFDKCSCPNNFQRRRKKSRCNCRKKQYWNHLNVYKLHITHLLFKNVPYAPHL